MKKQLFRICLAVAGFAMISFSAAAQTVSDFENLSIPADTFYDGSDFAGSFISGNAYFPNEYYYDSTYGGYWAAGFAYSSMRDSTDGSYMNMYSARPAIGAESSSTYALGQQGSMLRLTGAAAGKAINGVYLTNSTYAHYSMSNGDAFAKKFGGATGNDPDWFKVSIRAWYNGNLSDDSVEFYLADYRFADNSQDYILKDWVWVNLQPLGNADSVIFTLSSSDNGLYGMNTPPFFCMDNFTTADSPAFAGMTRISECRSFPNPATDQLFVDLSKLNGISGLSVFNMQGQKVYEDQSSSESLHSIDLSTFEEGIYILYVKNSGSVFTQKFTVIK
jgi:hypothetical protein